MGRLRNIYVIVIKKIKTKNLNLLICKRESTNTGSFLVEKQTREEYKLKKEEALI